MPRVTLHHNVINNCDAQLGNFSVGSSRPVARVPCQVYMSHVGTLIVLVYRSFPAWYTYVMDQLDRDTIGRSVNLLAGHSTSGFQGLCRTARARTMTHHIIPSSSAQTILVCPGQ